MGGQEGSAEMVEVSQGSKKQIVLKLQTLDRAHQKQGAIILKDTWELQRQRENCLTVCPVWVRQAGLDDRRASALGLYAEGREAPSPHSLES